VTGNVNVAINDQTSLTAATGTGARVGGVYYADDNGSATGAGTAEQTLATKTLPAKWFWNFNQAFTLDAFGTTAANGNTKTIKAYIGSATPVSFVTTAAAGTSWKLKVFVSDPDTTNNQRVYWEYDIDDGSTNTRRTGYVALTETVTSTIVVKITGTDGTDSAGDINCKTMRITAEPGDNS
jgi:hypothetical protein